MEEKVHHSKIIPGRFLKFHSRKEASSPLGSSSDRHAMRTRKSFLRRRALPTPPYPPRLLELEMEDKQILVLVLPTHGLRNLLMAESYTKRKLLDNYFFPYSGGNIFLINSLMSHKAAYMSLTNLICTLYNPIYMKV